MTRRYGGRAADADRPRRQHGVLLVRRFATRRTAVASEPARKLGYVGKRRPRLAHCRRRGAAPKPGRRTVPTPRVRSRPGAASTFRGHRPSGPRDFPQPRLVLTRLRDSCLVWSAQQAESGRTRRHVRRRSCTSDAFVHLPKCDGKREAICLRQRVRRGQQAVGMHPQGTTYSSLARATCRIGSGRRAHLARWLPSSGPSPSP